MKQTFLVPEIHCSSCVMLLETMEDGYDGIKEVKVDLGKRTAEVEFDEDKLSVEDVINAIEESSGYEVVND